VQRRRVFIVGSHDAEEAAGAQTPFSLTLPPAPKIAVVDITSIHFSARRAQRKQRRDAPPRDNGHRSRFYSTCFQYHPPSRELSNSKIVTVQSPLDEN